LKGKGYKKVNKVTSYKLFLHIVGFKMLFNAKKRIIIKSSILDRKFNDAKSSLKKNRLSNRR